MSTLREAPRCTLKFLSPKVGTGMLGRQGEFLIENNVVEKNPCNACEGILQLVERKEP